MTLVAARSMLTVGCFVLVGSLVCLLWATPGSSAFVLSCVAAGLGLVIVLAAVALARWTLQRSHMKEE